MVQRGRVERDGAAEAAEAETTVGDDGHTARTPHAVDGHEQGRCRAASASPPGHRPPDHAAGDQQRPLRLDS